LFEIGSNHSKQRHTHSAREPGYTRNARYVGCYLLPLCEYCSRRLPLVTAATDATRRRLLSASRSRCTFAAQRIDLRSPRVDDTLDTIHRALEVAELRVALDAFVAPMQRANHEAAPTAWQLIVRRTRRVARRTILAARSCMYRRDTTLHVARAETRRRYDQRMRRSSTPTTSMPGSLRAAAVATISSASFRARFCIVRMSKLYIYIILQSIGTNKRRRERMHSLLPWIAVVSTAFSIVTISNQTANQCQVDVNYYCEIKQVSIVFVVSFVIEIVGNLEFLCLCIALNKLTWCPSGSHNTLCNFF
jgi:hypothetical protein